MEMREFGDWKVWCSVDRHGDGPYVPILHAKNEALAVQRDHPFQGFDHRKADQATEFALAQLDQVTGVSSDGTLKFR